MKFCCILMTMTNQKLLRLFLRIVRLPVIAVFISTIGLVGCQARYIYHPRQYAPDLEQQLPKNVQQIKFANNEGQQIAFYIPPRAGGVPRQIWLGHSGNAGLALEWLDMAFAYPENDVGFLLVDYPGYGYCEGSCTPGRILANSEGAVAALTDYLSLSKEEVDARMCVFGHSLGSASTLQYVARHPVQKVVLVAPFTSMSDMVNHVMFWPMSWFLWHRFDNQSCLEALEKRSPQPPVIIIHGTQDEVIPFYMGQTLAKDHPGLVRFLAIPNGDHNGISHEIIIQCMTKDFR